VRKGCWEKGGTFRAAKHRRKKKFKEEKKPWWCRACCKKRPLNNGKQRPAKYRQEGKQPPNPQPPKKKNCGILTAPLTAGKKRLVRHHGRKKTWRSPAMTGGRNRKQKKGERYSGPRRQRKRQWAPRSGLGEKTVDKGSADDCGQFERIRLFIRNISKIDQPRRKELSGGEGR